MLRFLVCAAILHGMAAFGANAHFQNARRSPDWFTKGVMYQIQPRSFTDEGTLEAAARKLAYLHDLGVTIVYLVPVMKMDTDMDMGFWSPRQIKSGFGNPKNQYRIADYFHVDEEYGTDQDLRDFCAEAHRLGMKVLFDLVYLHCGPTAPFLKEHPEFTWWNPDGTVKKGPWRFPKLNFAEPGLRAYFMDNIKALVTDYGADGFRCDVGDGIPLDFWCDAHDMIDKLTGGDAVLLCEGFTVCDQYKGFDADYGWFPGLSAAKVRESWESRERQCPVGSRFVNHYENHDIATDARPRRELQWGHDAVDQVLVWMFAIDGVPLLFCGNELADADERHSMFGKTPMDWSQLDREPGKSRHSLVESLARLRREHSAFTDVNGAEGLTWLDTTANDDVTAFVRRNGRETILVVQNWTGKPVNCKVSFSVPRRKAASYLAPDETDRNVKGTIATEPLFARAASRSSDGVFSIGPFGWWISEVISSSECAFPGARGVLVRFAGETVAERFAFERMNAAEPQGEVSARNGKILVRATDENRAAAAVGRYIREVAKGHWSRSGNRVPAEWPLPEETLKVKAALPHMHAYNYCVFSYSFAFYGEEEWRANIDRLALSGFTSAVVPTANMKVWQLFLRDAGFSDEQIAACIPDETAQSWMNCGVMEGVGAPVPSERIDEEARLGRWVAGEMRALGIEPMLQGFTGLLPNSSTNVLTGAKWPDARLYDQGCWAGGLKRPVLLDATTDAYSKLAKMWYKRLYEVYGISDPRFFVGNLFSEGGVANGVDCRKIAAAMQREQQIASPGATWCISCWGDAPRQDLLDGLDSDHARIIVLDKNMANGGSFPRGFGKITWLWGELLNFGGNEGMYGGMDALVNLGKHIKGANGNTLRGYALESEGLDSNPVFYDLFTDLFFCPDAVVGEGALDRWLADYAERRYGIRDGRVERALLLLARSVWNVGRLQEGCSECVFCARPKWNVGKASSWASDKPLYYDPSDVEEAARLYLEVAKAYPKLIDAATFRFDFTDVFRQVISDRGRVLVAQLKDSPETRAEFIALVRLMDSLLACTDAFRLDTCEARARKRAGERGVRSLRRMFTTWIEQPNSSLNDYAHHQFAGLLANYYAKRWEVFFADPDNADVSLDELERTAPSAQWTVPPRGNDLLGLAMKALETRFHANVAP